MRTPIREDGSAARYDMHVHTSNSDGRWSPERVLAHARHLAGLCITDHSGTTYDGALASAAAAAGTQLLFPGIEISTTFDGRKYHVLGYGFGLLSADFADFAARPTKIKNDIYAEMLDELRAEGAELPDFEDMLAGRHLDVSEHPGRWMMSKTIIAAYLCRAGEDPDTVQARLTAKYDRLKQRHPDRYLPTFETVRKVRDFGGFPVIAHPWWECPSGHNTNARLTSVLADLRRRGLLGLEVSTRHQTVGTERFRRAVADELGLLPFAGSDFHANGKTYLGRFGLTQDELDAVFERGEAQGCVLRESHEVGPAVRTVT